MGITVRTFHTSILHTTEATSATPVSTVVAIFPVAMDMVVIALLEVIDKRIKEISREQ